jgi:hypothetical protein
MMADYCYRVEASGIRIGADVHGEWRVALTFMNPATSQTIGADSAQDSDEHRRVALSLNRMNDSRP